MQFITNVNISFLTSQPSHFVSDSLFTQEDCQDSSDASLVLSPSSAASVSQVRFFTLGVDKDGTVILESTSVLIQTSSTVGAAGAFSYSDCVSDSTIDLCFHYEIITSS